jgi:hypothetical protein
VPFAAGQKLLVEAIPPARTRSNDDLSIECCDGDICLKGHRISLGLFLEESFRLNDWAAVQARFSTLELAETDRLITLVEANGPLMLLHPQAQAQFEESLYAFQPCGPSPKELCQRAADRGIPLPSERECR